MIEKHKILFYLKYGAFASAAYCVSAFLYMRQLKFTQVWILYAGNMLFGAVIACFLFLYSKKKNKRVPVSAMIKEGHLVTVTAILLSCITCLLLLFALTPDIFQHTANTGTILKDAPAQLAGGRRHGFILILFMDAIIGNVSAGSFASILFPFALTRLQKDEDGSSGKII